MRFSSVTVSFSFISLHTVAVSAYWRMACSISQTARIDPILNPGTISGHVHKFAGGNNVDQSSTHDSLLASTCSTCEVQDDKSAYWTPQLYYQHADGTIEEVQNEGMTVYYVGRGGDSSNTVHFPVGFKMISGNSLLRHYDEQSLTYLDTRPIADRETHYLNDTNCVNGLRAQLNFQSCWDGVNLYSPGNTHVAYLSGIDYGVCPPTHPVPIPGLFFEVLYWTNRINQSGGGRFVFSNGDTTGFGFHGDFLNGWDQQVQQSAVQQCLYVDNGGTVSACAALAPSVNENFARICPESAPVIAEAVTGVLPTDHLPGCNPITSGPADAPQIICPVNSSTPVASQSPIASTPNASSAILTTVGTSQSSTPILFTTLSSATLSSTTTSQATSGTMVVTTTTTTSFFQFTTPAVSTRFRTFTRQTNEPQSSGGIFVPASSNVTTSTFNLTASSSISPSTAQSPDLAQPSVVSVTVLASSFAINSSTVTISEATSSPTPLSISPAELCSSWFGSDASFYCQTLIAMSTASSDMTNTNPSIGTKTTFITVYSPIVVTATSIADVTITATTPLNKRYEGPRRFRMRS